MLDTFLIFIFAIIMTRVEAYVQCGRKLCYGATAKCCSWDPNECCWLSWYTLWWTWVAAILLMVVLFSMIMCCFNKRRRHASTRHLIVVRPPNRYVYGTIPTNPPWETRPAMFNVDDTQTQLQEKPKANIYSNV